MSADRKSDLHLEIAHVLFIDVVGYSRLLADEQSETLQLLNQFVREAAEFRTAEEKGELIRLPTGDGMALVFLTKPEAPVQCAMEISKAIKSYPELQLRMGVHSGSVNQMTDVNDRSNVTGAGINMAQRVMDCGDAGHILLSQRVAEDLEQYRLWRPRLHDLGECQVKHGVRVHVFNLYTDEIGNRDVPAKLKPIAQEPAAAVVTSAGESARSKHKLIAATVLLMIALALGFGFWIVSHRAAPIGKPLDLPALPEKTAPESPEQGIQAFIQAFVRDMASNDATLQMPYYNNPCRYYDQGNTSLPTVQKDIQRDITEWKKRAYSLHTQPVISKTEISEYAVTFEMAYTLEDPKPRSSGILAMSLRLKPDNGTFLITEIQKTVILARKPHDRGR
jgi:class 3 adenylate cyclase